MAKKVSGKEPKAEKKTETRIILNTQELGTSGLKSQGGFVSEAFNTSLQWPQAYPIFNRLRRSTPEIVMIRNAFTAWARNISMTVTLPEEPTDDDKKYRDFVISVFDDMEGGFTGFADTLINHVPFMGWGWWEVVAGRRNPEWKAPVPKDSDEQEEPDSWKSEYDDDLIGIRRLGWRDAGTFYKWDLDDRTKKLKGMYQKDYPNPTVLLPLKDSLHLTYGDPNNPEGLSPLEAVWRLERIHYGYSVISGIGFEHAAGHLSVKKVEAGTLSSDDKQLVKNAAMAILAAQEGNYALWPYGLDGQVMDIGFAAAGSLLSAMQHYSTLMLSVYTMQWMALNTMTGTGSYAAADDSSTLGVYAFNGMLKGFSEQLDQQVGKKLWEWNKAAFPNATKRPKIGFTQIEKTVALSEMSSFVSQMKDVLPLGKDDLISIRKRSNFLPEMLPTKEEMIADAKDKAEITAAAQPPQPEQPAVVPNAGGWDSGSNWGGFSMDENGYVELGAAELHYGGVDGKQPHKDGSPQTVHGKKGSGVQKANGAKSVKKTALPFTTFDKASEAQTWAETQKGMFFDIDEEESVALDKYKRNSSYYKDINSYLRGAGKPTDEFFVEKFKDDNERNAFVATIDKAMKNNVMPEDVLVYRAMESKVIPKGAKGFTDKGFMSTSLSKDNGQRFTGFVKDNGGTPAIIEMKIPKGKNGIYLEHLWDNGEAEILLPRNSSFKIISESVNANGVRVIQAEMN